MVRLRTFECPLFVCGTLSRRRAQVRALLMSEAGETDTPSNADPPSPILGSKTSRDSADEPAADESASKRIRGSALALDDHESFARACDKIAPFFSDGTFPSIPRSCIDELSESAVAAACSQLVMTKAIAFPFHRQFTTDEDVAAMVSRCALRPSLRVKCFTDSASAGCARAKRMSCCAMSLLHALKWTAVPCGYVRRHFPMFFCNAHFDQVHTKFKPEATGQTRYMIFKPNDPSDFLLMDRLTDVFVEPSRLLSFRCNKQHSCDHVTPQ